LSCLLLYEARLPYAAAKAALSNYSKGLSNEVAQRGARVNTLVRGFIQTDGSEGMIDTLLRDMNIGREEALKMIMDSPGGIPTGRPAWPEEAAELAAFILSGRAAYLNGVQIRMDGRSVRTW